MAHLSLGNPVPAHRGAAAPRWSLRRVLQGTAALGLVFVSVLTGAGSTGCGGSVSTGGTSGTGGSAPFCQGGFVRKDPANPKAQGTCEGLCDATKCIAGNTCVDNKCALPCTTNFDCTPLTQACVAAVEDVTKKAIAVCQDNGKGPIGQKCPFGNECKTATSCPDGTACDPTCTGAACACAAADCKPLFCRTAGAGDADAFCTLEDCHADTDCPGGYWCGQVRSPTPICGPKCTASKCVGGLNPGGMCTKDGDCQKGNSNFCGTTTDACIDPSMDMANGTTYVEGPYCALRSECRIRKECDPCTTDYDCAAVLGQHCTQVATEKVCTQDCGSDADCEPSFQCTANACVPRFGACVGTGKNCEPCRNDLDCGGPGSKLACARPGGGTTEQKVCFDESLSTSCMVDADCPLSPGGLHGTCLGPNQNVMVGDPAYQKCYFPFLVNIDAYTCWKQNTGASCGSGSDCISKKCGAIDMNTGTGICQK